MSARGAAWALTSRNSGLPILRAIPALDCLTRAAYPGSQGTRGGLDLLYPLFTDAPKATSAATARLSVVAVNRLCLAGVADLIYDLQDFFAGLPSVLHPRTPVGVLNDGIRRGDAGGILHENAVRCQLRDLASVGISAEGIAGFDLHRYQPLGCFNQVVWLACGP
jgi:hypothetical protein